MNSFRCSPVDTGGAIPPPLFDLTLSRLETLQLLSEDPSQPVHVSRGDHNERDPDARRQLLFQGDLVRIVLALEHPDALDVGAVREQRCVIASTEVTRTLPRAARSRALGQSRSYSSTACRLAFS
jgi:hypothetical protein